MKRKSPKQLRIKKQYGLRQLSGVVWDTPNSDQSPTVTPTDIYIISTTKIATKNKKIHIARRRKNKPTEYQTPFKTSIVKVDETTWHIW